MSNQPPPPWDTPAWNTPSGNTPSGNNPAWNNYAPQPQASSNGPATGKQLLSATWGLLRQDRELLWLPAVGAITALFAALVVFGPGLAIGWLVGGAKVGGWVGGVLALFAASTVSIYFQAALVIGANQRADGGDPAVRSVLAEAWKHRGKILSWAALTTTVGVAIRAVEQRLGIVGNILGFLGGIAWAIASFLVVPIVIAENLGPIEAVKRSAELVRETWGTSVRTTLRFSLTYVALLCVPIVTLVIGIVAAASGTNVGVAVGLVLIAASIIALVALIMVFSAISTYARALIYRYATGRTVPGIDPHMFAGVFRQRRGRRGIA